MTENNELLIEGPISGVLILTLNRPKKMNALATPLLEKVAKACENGDRSESVRAIIITGGSKVFAAGADINELRQKTSIDGLNDIRPSIWGRIRRTRKPIIAAVEGFCLGAGNELLMCADIAVAGEGAKFGQPETNLGIIPGAGGASTLPRLVGRAQAMKMVLLGQWLSANQALSYGLVADVVAEGDALALALKYASKIASRAPLALEQGKAVVKATYDMPHEAQLVFERQAFSNLLSTVDKNEGIDAFLEKRDPKWC
jgi:Enoyl-CoA hydratase/carnithine racemase